MVSLPVSAGFNRKVELSGQVKKSAARAEFKGFIERALPYLVTHPDSYIGGWLEKDAGGRPVRLHLDVSERYDRQHLAAATQLGRERNQIAVWDVDNLREIATGGSGT